MDFSSKPAHNRTGFAHQPTLSSSSNAAFAAGAEQVWPSSCKKLSRTKATAVPGPGSDKKAKRNRIDARKKKKQLETFERDS